MMFSTRAPAGRPLPIRVEQDSEPALILHKDEKSFPLGRVTDPPAAGTHQFSPGPGDEAVLTIRRGMSWPTPFDFNFMSGHSPSWKRHVYYRLRWTKSNGPKLRMVWRFEQYFYPGDGWASAFMTHEGTTGLIRVDIEN
jgi:hypothetical protein